MTLHSEIKRFLTVVYSPDNMDGSRIKLEQAVALFKRIDAEMSGVKDSLTHDRKPEDKL